MNKKMLKIDRWMCLLSFLAEIFVIKYLPLTTVISPMEINLIMLLLLIFQIVTFQYGMYGFITEYKEIVGDINPVLQRKSFITSTILVIVLNIGVNLLFTITEVSLITGIGYIIVFVIAITAYLYSVTKMMENII